ncbi:contact-dependent growth inhibition system immunity protein [Burkholderia latens]|uniref:CdiI immunity protein domain-containing protein n=1 Tax=Burkholderia latens TaxID=488446 RepID=A0A6H9SV74_9BURK|nr:contact-dependent growth inhibition system immunity protein [Burkholderia latens]KAB0635779.1 hypothetical protein F7R21_23850 [Burkholderia latens]VWB37482.1 hypothetical protein BLA24064_01639 [Burkholderia latens]
MDTKHVELDQFISIYFGQDFDLFGNTIPEIVADYVSSSTEAERKKLLFDIDEFISLHPTDMEDAFENQFGKWFGVDLWGHTAKSFLEEIKRLLP